MINSTANSHTHDSGRVCCIIRIKSALLIPVMYSPMYGWVTEEELKELR